jgi:hypothetical protein
MPMDQEGATRAVGAPEPGEHIPPAGCTGFDILRQIADPRKLLGDPLRALGLALRGLGFAGVGGIEPDQPADNLNHIIAWIGWKLGRPALKGHNPLSYHCQGRQARARNPRRRGVGELGWVPAGQSDSLSCQPMRFGLVRVAEWQTR